VFQKLHQTTQEIATQKERDSLLTHLASDCSRSAPLLQQDLELQVSKLIQVDQNNDRLETAIVDDEAEVFGGKSLPLIDTSLSNEEYVKLCIKRA
jgi:hypothetical protein